MNKLKKWIIYGATGETGRRIVEQAIKRGHRPLIAGRSEKKLAILGDKHGLQWKVLKLDKPQELLDCLRHYDLIINAANPFSITRKALLEAALKSNAHYLDIANDVNSMQNVKSFDEEALQKKLCVMSGAGFGTMASGSLLKHLHQQMPTATKADIIMNIQTSVLSTGALVSAIQEFDQVGTVIKQGQHYSLAKQNIVNSKLVDSETVTLVAAPMGDLQAAYQSTAIPNINLHLVLGMPYGLANVMIGYAGLISKIKQSILEKCFSLLLPIVNKLQRKNAQKIQSKISIELTDENGNRLMGHLITGEGYDFSVQASVLAVEEVLSRSIIGAQLPGQAFETDLVLQIHGVHLRVHQQIDDGSFSTEMRAANA